MSNRVGIVSLFGLYNFGNRLQNHALDKLLSQEGAIPTTLVFPRKLGLSVLKSKTVSATSRIRASHSESLRKLRFQDFISTQKVETLYTPKSIKTLRNRYDYFVVGSDQIWHPQADLYPGTKFLEFAAPSQRFAVAPSFGVSSIPEDQRDHYAASMQGFRDLSVREDDGARIVEGLTGITPTLLGDPTLGLSAEYWRTVSAASSAPEEKYILLYFLGEPSPETVQMIENTSTSLKAKTINLADRNSKYWGSGPQDFLKWIQNASLVLTDSYHASIFSAIFEVPFFVFPRVEVTSTYSRISTLLESLGLEMHSSEHLKMSNLLDQDFSRSRVALNTISAGIGSYVNQIVNAERPV